ncbi:predicted protein [Phaeodactylum tricornutum CCAP 1055/1]|jgi:molecular chaperone HscB|uniref:J domain-containing protein n=2 Tax=Phaeodactylum tricornutum TaxID=2850 RepID=B7FYT6_PHATC|nr:predicted protein [Phaeodactylum tricornutum CCAP 1055/1]EEC48226.1 predicted protein [Phaeodactylum tricornutum CCAP 1055/1]|eukprot:XP_002180035.1 predicted protein [Phaeodactylum tricornutum CCAP 1055/1]
MWTVLRTTRTTATRFTRRQNQTQTATAVGTTTLQPDRWMSSAAQQEDPRDEDGYSDSCTDLRHSTPQQPVNHFATMGLTPQFVVDEQQLKQSYKRLMTSLHPDKHTLKSQSSQDESHDLASRVTLAYDVLRQSLSRASHLLELNGRGMEDTASGKLVGACFLMHVMDLREQIDEANDDASLKKLWDENEVRSQQVCDGLAEAFAQEDFDEALRLTGKLQYWNRVQETIREKIGSLHDA